MLEHEEERRDELGESFEPLEETTAADFVEESIPEAEPIEPMDWSAHPAEPHDWETSGPESVEEAPAPAEELPRQEEPEEKAAPDYADAHYEPAGESTVPPRYYTPPERPVREQRPKKNRKSGAWLKVACLALVCAMLGGLLGAGITGSRLNRRIEALEQVLTENSESVESLSQRQKELSGMRLSSGTESGGLPASTIYENACRQVVGIKTNVTTNFFGMTTSSAVSGSGFIISEDGYIITNYHVVEYAVEGQNTAEVILYDGTKYDARIVGTEQSNDIAVLKIEAAGLSPVTIGDSDSILVGDTVYPVGNPLGELEFSMSTGHVSALNRVISTQESESISMFQIDAAVNPGNSGGPVYNALGQVIGVVTAKYSDTDVEGLGFAIPINDAMKIADDLITKGYVTGKAWLGVTLRSDYGVDRYSVAYAQYYNMPLGAYVESVTHGGAAEKAGLQANDIITKLGDTEVSNYNDLKNAIRHYSAGESAEMTFYRAGESHTVTVTFDEAVPEGAKG